MSVSKYPGEPSHCFELGSNWNWQILIHHERLRLATGDAQRPLWYRTKLVTAFVVVPWRHDQGTNNPSFNFRSHTGVSARSCPYYGQAVLRSSYTLSYAPRHRDEFTPPDQWWIFLRMTVNAGYSTRLNTNTNANANASTNTKSDPFLMPVARVPLNQLSATTGEVDLELHLSRRKASKNTPRATFATRVLEIASSLAKYTIFSSCAKKDAPARCGCHETVNIVLSMREGSKDNRRSQTRDLAAARDSGSET
ncbi:hypothetical protein C8R47DRAFT_1066628 [Mycena vitilis]|nr:hypothetical protein C8R47DRAFT_1066628 [Mycena vitilis]